MVWDDSMLGEHTEQLKWGMWESIENKKYKMWKYILKPIHFIHYLTENKEEIIISYMYEWEKNIKLSFTFK